MGSEDISDSDCAWEFDASALECLEVEEVTGEDFDLNDYNPVYSTYSFKDSVAEPLLLSLLHRKLVRLPKPPRLEGMWKTGSNILCVPQNVGSPHHYLFHPQ